jgi:hypothetical protein
VICLKNFIEYMMLLALCSFSWLVTHSNAFCALKKTAYQFHYFSLCGTEMQSPMLKEEHKLHISKPSTHEYI